MASVHAATVSTSPWFSATHSSVSSGRTSSCTRDTVTWKSAGSSVPFGVDVNVSTSPADAPTRCVVEVVGDPALADLVGPVLGVERADRLAVAGGLEVERDVVAGGCRALDVDERAVALQLGVDRLLHLVVGRRRVGQLDAQAAVAGDGDLGAHLTRGVEGDRALLGAARHLDLGRRDEVDVVLAHGLGQVLGDGVLQCLLAGGADADAGLEHPARRLAGAEPREADLTGDLLERLVDVAVELGLVDRDRHLDLVPLEGLHGAVHRASRLGPRAHGPVRLAPPAPTMVPWESSRWASGCEHRWRSSSGPA